jgi:uncharacterized protein DUF4288
MTWYAAHVIMYVRFTDGQQDSYPVWENVFLVESANEETARTRAEELGRGGEGDSTGSMKWAGRPGSWVFAGVRKLVKCDSDPEPPRHGTEVTYSEFSVDSLDTLRELAAGRRVRVDEYD